MADEKSTISRPVELVTVPVITRGDASLLETGTVAVTPGDHQPNFVIKAISPLVAYGVRFAYLFMFTLSGFLSAKMMPTTDNPALQALQSADLYHLVMAGASVSLAAACWGLIKDVTAGLSKLASKYPLESGSI